MMACFLLLLWPFGAWATDPVSPPFIKFLGAARMVSGSSYLVNTGSLRILIDCGSFMEGAGGGKSNRPDIDPAGIDIIILTHAHADHAGHLPILHRQGFRGKVFATNATKALLGITLEQSRKIMEEKGEYDYSREDIDGVLSRFTGLPYNKKIVLSPQVSLRFRDAGHILGSAMVELWIRDKTGPIKIVATGDMGSGIIPLLPPPTIIEDGDYVLIESTYGPMKRSELNEKAFGEYIARTLAMGGSVLIPAFTLDRTQKVLYVLGNLKKAGIIPADTPVYGDSSSADAITRVYRRYGTYHAQYRKAEADPLSFPGFRQVRGAASLAAHDVGRPAVYVTSSGMLDHGQAPRHLSRMIGDERNLLAIVSWQAPGTIGAKLQQGVKTIAIPGDEPGGAELPPERSVKIRVKTFDIFSGHADGCGLLTWLAHFRRTKKVMVVHGEEKNALGLARIIRENLGFDAVAPSLGETISLRAAADDHLRNAIISPCKGVTVSPGFSFPAD
ncbi:MAG: Ribonuclease [Syntrophus sp. SKADARSKE-3]|nr:Ribonuclease [Syntrophus sp. SKADARSKE-3]